jgi:hypothetical protein
MKMLLLPALIALSSQAVAAQPKTAEAVLAADDAWLKAELAGDTKFLDQLLLPEYRSVGAGGKVADKSKIIAHAQKAGGTPELAAQVASWKAAHPIRGEVSIFGDTAVLRWVLIKPENGDPVSSSDIFVYRDGQWRAIYSQHTSAEN